MIVTVKELLQNTNSSDLQLVSFTKGNCSKEEIKELEKKIEEKKKDLKKEGE